MTDQITTVRVEDPQTVINLVLDGLTSSHSKRAYQKALEDFYAWHIQEGRPGLNKATVQRYKTVLQEAGLSPSTVNLKMSALRKLAREAYDNGLLEQSLANGVTHVPGVTAHGVRAGHWLTLEEAQVLLDTPDIATLKGLRDRAVLAVMIGGGLRRSEVAALLFEHIQQRDGRWVIVDLVGKGNRVRTVPIPPWVKAAIDAWALASVFTTGRVFRPVHKGGFINGDSITPQSVQDLVKEYAGVCGFGLAAHDLRRTFAKLAHKGGSGIDQIQLSLGHASIKTTERYLGVEQSLTDAPCDHIRISLL